MIVKLIYLSSGQYMHKKLLALFVLLNAFVFSQVIDDFSDGDFINSPIWTGSIDDFVVNTSQEVQLNNTIASTSYLSTPHNMSTLDNQEWRVWTKQSFSPSSGNNGRIYLTSDDADLTNTLNGYYIQLGESGSSDALRLFKMEAGSSTLLCSGSDGQIASSFEVSIKVIRSEVGEWTLYADFSGQENYTFQNSTTDAGSLTGSHFGFLDTYTSSNSTKFYYDDIYIGNQIVDTEPPVMQEVNVINTTSIDLLFDEELESTSAENTSNYEIQPSFVINAAVLDISNPSLVHISLVSPLQNGSSYTIFSNNIEDNSGNLSDSQSLSFEFLIGEIPSPGDVIISEIFADPSPIIGLPDVEYVEIYNGSDKIFDLSNWKLNDASSSGTIVSGWIMPDSYIVLSSTSNVDSFLVSTLPVTSFPSLNNAGDDVVLIDPNGIQIDMVSYTDDWYKDDIKKSGGYSLEIINPNDPCSDISNWMASISPTGGTPGLENSVYDNTPDEEAPFITQLVSLPPNFLEIYFSEGMDSSSLVNASIFTAPGLTIQNIYVASSPAQSMIIEFNEDIETGTLYSLSIQNAQDCWLNSNEMLSTFAMTEIGILGDLIINEFVSNPYNDGKDWVELFNNSNKYIDLLNWQFANFDNDTIDNFDMINDHYVLHPGDYVVIGEDSSFILENYPSSVSGTFLISDLPTYSNDSSTIYLMNESNLIDKVSYNADWHFSLLDDTDGISLERIDPNGPSEDSFNWHSAAENIGFGTPGRVNSQYIPAVYNGEYSFTNNVFSPDNDGFEDVLQVTYELNKEGLLGQVSIYDDKGRIIKNLFSNELLGTTGSFSWDGTTNEGVKASIGVYVMLFEAFSTDGSVFFTQTKACTLAGKI
ncbi:MAG: lamin tail domain-containing protein [Crocinitomicaceae bacterium]|nr:lamin tail domain-containing protein [Crocinitomicaceae bacterium]